jgi:hypothetical protein
MSADIAPGVTVLEPHECWALLRSTEVGRLAVAIMNQADIFPVNYVVDHGTVVFRTAEGTKLAAATLGSAVAFEVDGYEPTRGEAWSVVLKGRAVEVENLHELVAATDLPLFPWHAAPKPRFVRVQPSAVTGRRFRVVDRVAAGEPTPGARHRASHE